MANPSIDNWIFYISSCPTKGVKNTFLYQNFFRHINYVDFIKEFFFIASSRNFECPRQIEGHWWRQILHSRQHFGRSNDPRQKISCHVDGGWKFKKIHLRVWRKFCIHKLRFLCFGTENCRMGYRQSDASTQTGSENWDLWSTPRGPVVYQTLDTRTFGWRQVLFKYISLILYLAIHKKMCCMCCTKERSYFVFNSYHFFSFLFCQFRNFCIVFL